MSRKISIVGAGPTGLTLALMVQSLGYDVSIYEASERSDMRPRAVMLHARALEILAPLGVADSLIKRGLMTSGIDFIRSDGAQFKMDFSDLESSFAGILNIRQPDIEEILASTFIERGGVIYRNFLVTSLQEKDQYIIFHVVNPNGTTSKIETNWLFGCDGGRSTIRRLIAASFDGDTIEYEYILGEGEREQLGARNVSCMLISNAGVVSWLPFKDGTVRVAGPGRKTSLNLGNDTSVDPQQKIEEFFLIEQSYLISDPRYRIGKLDRAGQYRVHSRIASSWGCGRIWLAGDSAHLHPPAGGQALNLGLADAEAIAMRLADPLNISFDTYEAERRPIVMATIEEVSMLPLIAAMRSAKSDVDFEKIENELIRKAHRLSQIDTNFLAKGSECLGDRDDKEIRVGRRLNESISLGDAMNAPRGWKVASIGEYNYWVHADRHVRLKSLKGNTRFLDFPHFNKGENT